MSVFRFSAKDAVDVLRRSSNINASLKKFLKREVRRGDGLERMVKDLRELLIMKEPTAAIAYFEKHQPESDAIAVALGGYAHQEAINAVVAPIVEKHADRFNTSYTTSEENIDITNQAVFDEIVKEVRKAVIEGAKKSGFQDSPYFEQVALATIFERPVLRKVLSTN